MDNTRLFTWAFFGMMLWLTYQAWQQDYGPKTVETPVAEDTAPALPEESDLGLPEVPADAAEVPSLPSADSAPETEAAAAAAPSAAVINVRTDVLDLDISTQGGTLQRAALPAYPVAKDRPDEPVILLSTERENLGLIRTGLRSTDSAAPKVSSCSPASPNASCAWSSTPAASCSKVMRPVRWMSVVVTGPNGPPPSVVERSSVVRCSVSLVCA